MADLQESDRLKALAGFEILDTPSEPLFDSLTELAAKTFETPIALISLVDDQRQWFKSCIGLDVDHTARDISFCQHAIRSDDALIVLDARLDPLFAANPLVTGPPNIRFYAGAPLITSKGHRLGTLCVIDTVPRSVFDETRIGKLRALANSVMQALELRIAAREREQLAMVAQERAALLAQAERMAGVGTWFLDVATDQTTWSDEVYRIHGIDPSNGSPELAEALACYRPDDARMVGECMSQAVATGEAFDIQARIVRPDGEERDVLVRGACRFGADGVVIGLFGAFQDVTALRLADLALRESEARSRHLLENASDMIVRSDQAGVVIEVSPACRAFGYEAHEIVGLTTSSFLHPDDVEQATAARRNNFNLQGPDLNLVREYRIRKKDGGYRWVQGSPTILRREDGTVGEVISIFRDITDRKEAELALAENEVRYRLLAENARDIIACYGPDGRFTYLSSAATNVLGYGPEELLGKTPMTFMHPDDVKLTIRTLAAYAAAGPGASAVRFEYRAFRKDGTLVWLEANPRAIFDPETGGLREFQDTVRDVTRRKAMEFELATARDDAVDAMSVKSEFLANMSHEIRTPLTAILGFSSLLSARSDLTETAMAYVKRVSGASKALLATVNDILDFSKLEAGQMSISPSAVDVSELAQDAIAMFAPQAEEKSLWLEFEEVSSAPPLVLIDPDRVRQILLNLIGNAIKFTDAGTVRLRLGYNRDSSMLRLEVQDTGSGMDETQCQKLFQRFSQVDASSTRRHGGTGLGLAISKALVEAMDGEIGVASVPGQGSTFYFEVKAPEGSASVVEGTLVDGNDANLSGIRVLLADDNASNRVLARLLLEQLGADVTEVEDGQQALDAAMQAPFDVILLDLHMPVMDGSEALMRLRADDGPNQNVPVLAFTADSSNSALEAGGGFDGVVGKPIVAAEFILELERVTHWQEPVSSAERRYSDVG